MFKSKVDKFAGECYLELHCAGDYPEQCPEYKFAKWYDLLWLLIPICGIIPFSESIASRGK